MLSNPAITDWLTGVGLFVGLVAAEEICSYLGNRIRISRAEHEHPDQLATIQAAMLGLLALLLGFSFALAAGRFSGRAQLIVDEANAIGTAWLRCDLLPDKERAELRGILSRYIEQRIALYEAKDIVTQARVVAESEVLQSKMWGVVSAAGRSSPLMADVLWPPFNTLFDVHGARVAASEQQMPLMMLLLLLTCSLVTVAAVGYGVSVAGKRNVVMTTALIILIAGALWVIIDMDHPRMGLIRTGQQPMLDLQKSLAH